VPPAIDRTIGAYHDSSNARIRKIGQYTGPAAYVTGGDPLAPGDLGMGRIEILNFEPATNGTVILLVRYDYVNQKVKFFDLAGNESANALALGAYTARFEAVGK
jgi:hypothetical protein